MAKLIAIVADSKYFIKNMLSNVILTRVYVPISIGGTVSHMPPKIITFITIQTHLIVFLKIATALSLDTTSKMINLNR